MATYKRKKSALANKKLAKTVDIRALEPSKRKWKSAASKKLNLLIYKYHALGDYPN
jgi:hypothetical protein